MFNKTRSIDKERKLAKKSNNNMNEKRIENVMRVKLREKLEANLRTNDSVEIEVAEKYISLFISIIMTDFANDYEYVQVEPTLFIFKAKEISWDM